MILFHDKWNNKSFIFCRSDGSKYFSVNRTDFPRIINCSDAPRERPISPTVIPWDFAIVSPSTSHLIVAQVNQFTLNFTKLLQLNHFTTSYTRYIHFIKLTTNMYNDYIHTPQKINGPHQQNYIHLSKIYQLGFKILFAAKMVESNLLFQRFFNCSGDLSRPIVPFEYRYEQIRFEPLLLIQKT